MFERAQEILDGLGRNGYKASVSDPDHCTISPGKFADDYDRYQIAIESWGTYFQIKIEPDISALALPAAIRSGYIKNQLPAEHSKKILKDMGWEANIRLEDMFQVEATNYQLASELPEMAVESVIRAALELNDFCLQYLTVARFGPNEFSDAVERDTTPRQDKQPWEFDPSELDRQTVEHRKLENWLIRRLRIHELRPLDPAHSAESVEFDVAWETDATRLVVCEVKTTANNPTKQIRLGIGQVLHYAVQIQLAGKYEKIIPALLVQNEWNDPSLDELARRADVHLFSPELDVIPAELLK